MAGAGFANNLLAQLNLGGNREAGDHIAQMMAIPLFAQLGVAQESMQARRPGQAPPYRNVRARTNQSGNQTHVPVNQSGAARAAEPVQTHSDAVESSGVAPDSSEAAHQVPGQGSRPAARGSSEGGGSGGGGGDGGGRTCQIQ